MHTILIPSKSIHVQELLTKNNINFQTLNESYLLVNEISDKLLLEISLLNDVYIISDNKPLKKYLCFKPMDNKITKKKNNSYNPVDLKKIYNFPNLTNSKKINIGIIELGGGFLENDLATYWKYLALTEYPTINSISVDGAKNNPGLTDEDYEVTMDIEIIGGICPNSIINVYFGQNTNTSFFNTIAKAIFDKNQLICICCGAPEIYYSINSLKAFDTLFQSAANQGITICVASGDNGYKDNGITIGVDFPASSPNVLSVGGTSLYSTLNVYDTEKAWSGSGGGYSNYFNKPTYQNNILKANNKRCVPDISANADPNTGYIIYLRGKYYTVGGTSAAAPLWCGYLGCINYSKFLNSNLYPLIGTNSFHDITKGTNGYSAKINYDLCTGLGSLNGINLFNKLK